jgi:phosphate transport system substrate-binding protein
MSRTLSLISLAVFQLCPATPPAAAQSVLTGAGATFPAPLYQKWFAEYSKLHPEVRFTYQLVGSEKGQQMIVSRKVDFGASDAPMDSEALANAPAKIDHIPTVGGADVVVFNLHSVKELRLDGPTLAGIFLGKITQWNHPAIVKQNPGVRMPEEDITVVHRSEGSGTTYIFTDYLSSISPEWKLKVGKYLEVNWPLGVGVEGSSGLANFVRKTPGAIGYVELLYAVQNGLPQAKIKNSSGAYITASVTSVQSALESAKITADLRFSAVNAPGRSAYPISGVTWLLVYRDLKDGEGDQFSAFLRWALTDGQRQAAQMDYSPLPKNLRDLVLGDIGSAARSRE